MHQPLLIADSGGTKTDWCYVDSHQKKYFFTSESYHPSNWSDDFIGRISNYWDEFPDYKSAEVYFFCAGCLKSEKAEELAAIFNKIGFENVKVKSDLHAAGIALYGKENGSVAILGTGSVFFEWKDFEVTDIIGGKGFEIGDEGSGFYFGKLIFQAYENNTLTIEQRRIFEVNVDFKCLKDALTTKHEIKKHFSQLPEILKNYKIEFKEWHEKNIKLFFESIELKKNNLKVKVVGGYFAEHSTVFCPYLPKIGIEIEGFIKKPISSLVDYFVSFTE